MSDHAANKLLVAEMLEALASSDRADVQKVLQRYCEPEAPWEVFHPFNSYPALEAVCDGFWGPMRESFPDYEFRIGQLLAGEFEGADWISVQGQIMGSFEKSWIGIPATHGLVVHRFGLNVKIAAGRVSSAYVLLDIVDVMRQAGFYPFRRMPGSAEQWPLPPLDALEPIARHDPDQGAVTLEIIREMQAGLGDLEQEQAMFGTYPSLEQHSTFYSHSQHWHPNMNWYGPAGIGSTRGERGFLNHHCALFVQAFPDRGGSEPGPRDPDSPFHYVQLGDGRFGVTSGWPSLRGTHVGSQWLGLAPTGRRVDMRVADWYRVDADNLLIDNWVMIDIPHILCQVGLDLLDDLRFLVDPTLDRWPGADDRTKA